MSQRQFASQPAWLFAVLLTLIAGCAAPGARVPPTEVVPVELTYMTVDSGAWADAEQELLTQYQAVHPNVTIKATAYQRQPASYLDDADPPDLMLTLVEHPILAAVEAGKALSLDEVWTRSDLGEQYPPTFQAVGRYNGRQYLLPVGYAWTAVYYNRALFEELDLQPPQTWTEFEFLCDDLLMEGITPIALPARDSWSLLAWFDYLDLRLNGPAYQRDLLAGEARFDDPAVATVFEVWRDWLERGYFGQNSRMLNPRQALELVVRGQAGMLLSNAAPLGEMPAEWHDQLDFFPLPAFDPDMPLGEAVLVAAYLIPQGAAHPAEATNFVATMSDVTVQGSVFRQLGPNFGVLPVHQGIALNEFSPSDQQGAAIVQGADELVLPTVLGASPRLVGALYQGLNRFLSTPDDYPNLMADLALAQE